MILLLGAAELKKHLFLDFSTLLRDGKAVCDVPYQTAFFADKKCRQTTKFDFCTQQQGND